MPSLDDASATILDHVNRAMILADRAGLTDVGISLNQALLALGYPGVALPGSDPIPNQGNDAARAFMTNDEKCARG